MSDLETQRIALTQAIGECIAAWSEVELHLGDIFRWIIGGGAAGAVIADAVLATPRNFEVRSLMIHNVMRIRLAEQPSLNDWNLLYNYVQRMGKLRNEVAHATMLSVGNEVMVLEPYFVMTQPHSHISVDEVKERAIKSKELAQCLHWFYSDRLLPKPPIIFHVSTPDLLLRLQTQDAQTRATQRAQQKPFP